MSGTFKRLGQSELLPRYVFAEGLIARRRVLELGAVASTGGESAVFLVNRGARQVVAADADLAAVQAAALRHPLPGLRFRASAFDDFESGSFDVILVADLAPYVRAPENLKELKRLLARTGSLVAGLRNPSGLSLASIIDPEDGEAPPTYGQALDALATCFPSVEVATQSPVLGYQLAFERGDGLQVDGSLAGTSEAAYYVLLAGEEPVRSFDPTWVQLPPEPLAFNGAKLEDASARARDWRLRADSLKDALGRKSGELDRQQATLQETREQLDDAREAVSRLTAQLEAAREAPEALRDRDDLAARIRTLEVELELQRQRAADAEARVTRARVDQEAQEVVRRDATVAALAAQEQGRLERARREELGTQLEDARGRLAEAHAALLEATREAGQARAEAERSARERSVLEDGLAEREARLTEARQRELALADQRTEALTALEGLQGRLGAATAELAQARALVEAKEADRLSSARALESANEGRQAYQARQEALRAEVAGLQAELERRQEAEAALRTDLQAVTAAHQRALRDAETVASSERHWRELASQYEERLAGATQDIEQLNDQLARLEGARDAEVARARRLELDVGTALTAGRTAQEQAEAALAEVRAQHAALLAQAAELQRHLAAREAGLAETRAQASSLAAQLDGATRALAGEVDASASREQELQAAVAEQAGAFAAAAERGASAERRAEAAEAQRKVQDERAAFLEEQVRGLQSDLEVAEARAVETRRELEVRHQARLEALVASSQAASERLASTTAEVVRLAAVEARAGTLEQDLAAAREALDEERRQLASANAELVHLARSIEVQGQGLEAHGRQALELDARLQLLEQEKRQLAQSLGTAMSEAAHLTAELEESQAARRAEQSVAEALRVQASLEVAERERLRAGWQQAQLETQQAQAAAAAERAEAGALTTAFEAELEAARSRASALEVQLEQARSGSGALASELEARQGSVAELEAALAEARSEAARPTAMETVLATAQERAALAEVELSTLTLRVAALEAELAEAVEPQRAAEEALRVARRRLAQAEAELELARGRAAEDLAAERAGRAQAEELLISLRASYGDLQLEVREASEALAEARAERDLLEQDRQRVAGQLEEVPTLRGELTRLQLELIALRRAGPTRAAPPAPIPLITPQPSTGPELFEVDVDVSIGGEAEEIAWSDEDEPPPGRPRR